MVTMNAIEERQAVRQWLAKAEGDFALLERESVNFVDEG